ncbi:response regulator transcription factor [Streptomyces sp. NPDC020951]|uniref:response regulator transcription factor n=1 Tax=Streptomyces sp. NPDC020951 TaxID=3365104 RepID=UPI0037B830BD
MSVSPPVSPPVASLLPRPVSPPRGDGQQVLVVAADPADSELVSTALELAGYRVGTAGSGAEGLVRLDSQRFDLLVWDAALRENAYPARRRRAAPADRPPLLFLATCDALPRLVPDLAAEQEDYVTKPLRIAELLARVAVLLRGRRRGPRADRPHHGDEGDVIDVMDVMDVVDAVDEAGRIDPADTIDLVAPVDQVDLVMDDAACQARRGPRPLALTPAEYRLLRHLLANAECVLSKEQISRHVWGESRAGEAIEKLVSRLRHKVDREGPALIHTRRGFGYWLGRADL